MGYWEEKRKYEKEKHRLSNPEAHLTERERDRKRVYENEFRKLGGMRRFGGGFILVVFGVVLALSGGVGSLIGLVCLIAGIVLTIKSSKQISTNRAIAWEKALKKVPLKYSKKKKRK